MADSVVVDKRPNCNLCQLEHRQHPNEAKYDAKSHAGPWAFMCDEHFESHGKGLGTGLGQRLLLKGEADANLG